MISCGERHDAQMVPAQHIAQSALIEWGGFIGAVRGFADRRGRLILAAATAFGAQVWAHPASAQAGFLDQLFGPLFRPPAYGYQDHHAWGARPGYRGRWHHLSRHYGRNSAVRERFIVIERPDDAEEGEQPAERQQPVDIMQDESLEFGDAVMTEAGIRVFVGDSGDSHGPEDFRRPSEVRGLSKRERKALAALDAKESASDVTSGIVTGRSASDSKITAGEKITDAKGRAIRYVGP
jgi:hypothetical protein